jgi:hypothetical protein
MLANGGLSSLDGDGLGPDSGPVTGSVSLLSRDDCIARLECQSIGRVAVTSRALPAIVPVNYRVSGSSVVFRTEPGGMLARACDNTVVAFEVDDIADDGRSGWSVLVVGVAELLDGSAALRAMETGVVSAAGDDREQFVAITLGQVSGRRVGDGNTPESRAS